MKSLARMPPVPAPPHDPLSTILAGWLDREPRAGFRARRLEHIEVQPACQSLVLAPSPDATRLMTEASGSFGGLRAPINVAVSDGGAIVLLDPVSGRLLRFDACRCRFVEVPCLTRVVACEAAPARRYIARDLVCHPHGIDIHGDCLLVADSGHARVLRFSMDGFIPRRPLTLPAAQAALRSRPWFPFALAHDGHGVVYASDPHNQVIDVFDAHGRWREAIAVSEPAWALAVDASHRLHALLAAADDLAPTPGARARWDWVTAANPPVVPRVVRIVDGAEMPLAPEDLQREAFVPPRVVVDADGFLHLPCEGGAGDFDARGVALPAAQRVLRERYQRQGRFESAALDSRIEGCQWHRVELRGDVPAGCRLAVQTVTAQVELDADELAALPESAWSEGTVAAQAPDGWPGGRWDCLISSPRGRFLWLRVNFTSDGHDTPRLCAAVLEFPRISLRRHLPAVFGADPHGADFTDRLTALFDTTLRSIERNVDRFAANLDPLSAPAGRGRPGEPDFLGWLASWIGITLLRGWPEARQRRFVKDAARLYGLRGTPEGLRRQLLLMLGFDTRLEKCADERPRRHCLPRPLNCGLPPARRVAEAPALLLEHFRLRRWLFAGRSRLGDESVLWGRGIVDRSQLSGPELGEERSGNARLGVTRLDTIPDPVRDPLRVHAHRFSVFVPARLRQDAAERRVFEQLLARETPAHTVCDIHYVEPRFRVGQQAMIGLDSVIARTPCGVTLDDNRLGQGTVLSAAPGHRRPPALRVGDTRVGTTSAIT